MNFNSIKKNMRLLALLIIFFNAYLLCTSQNVTIKGVAKTFENEEIGVWIHNDYISNTQKQLTYSTIDSIGNFTLEFNTKEIQYITLKVEKNISSLYVEPKGNYDIILFPPDSTTYQNPNLEHDVKLSIKLKSKTEINSLTMDYDDRFEEFMVNSYLRLRAQTKIDSFKLAMNEYYSTVNNPYFKNYIRYTIAALEQKTKMSENLPDEPNTEPEWEMIESLQANLNLAQAKLNEAKEALMWNHPEGTPAESARLKALSKIRGER